MVNFYSDIHSRVSQSGLKTVAVIRNFLACVANVSWKFWTCSKNLCDKIPPKIVANHRGCLEPVANLSWTLPNSVSGSRNDFTTRQVCEINTTKLRTNCDINNQHFMTKLRVNDWATFGRTSWDNRTNVSRLSCECLKLHAIIYYRSLQIEL